MTTLRFVPSDVGGIVDLAPYGPRQPAAQPVAGRTLPPPVSAKAPAVVRTVLCSWRQAVEARRARDHLKQLDDHLLRDIGLSRVEAHFGDFGVLNRRRRWGGIA
jgi:uncharacterized protein YjiS (DUF1127 family)